MNQQELIPGTNRDVRNAELFWAKVETHGNDISVCWPWKAAVNEKGYGRFAEYHGGGKGSKNRRIWLAHRYAFKITYGGIDEALCACHSCDNPACCNPTHIFLGTRADNNADMRAKSRGAKPPPSRRWKVTADMVQKLCALKECGYSYKAIARRHSLSDTHVRELILEAANGTA